MLNTLTFQQLETLCLEKAGLSDQDVSPGTRRQIINDALFKKYNDMDGINDPFYHEQVVISTTQGNIGGQFCMIDISAMYLKEIISLFDYTT